VNTPLRRLGIARVLNGSHSYTCTPRVHPRDRSFFRLATIHAYDRQTDRQTDRILIARQRLHSMQHGNNTSVQLTLTVPCWEWSNSVAPQTQPHSEISDFAFACPFPWPARALPCTVGKTPGFARSRQHRINGFVLFKVLYCNVSKSNMNCVNLALSVHIC